MVSLSNIMIRHYTDSQYTICFNRETGFFLRTGDMGQEPFWNVHGPELLDVSITNYCEQECEFCYRASNRSGAFMDLKEYCRLIEQAEEIGVLQIALGGGNPNQHPEFIKILEETRKHFIIPSYTTNGQGMTEDIYFATKKYCGALAVSWYAPYDTARIVVEKCYQFGIKANIHFLLSNKTVGEAIRLLKEEENLLQKVNAIIFLNYKPVHGNIQWILEENEDLHEFLAMAVKTKVCKVGFDSCMISYLTLFMQELQFETVEFCEAARFSAFISEDSLLYPCSFMKDTAVEGIDLKRVSLQEGWQTGKLFTKIRSDLQRPSVQKYPIGECLHCEKYEFCHGGCQIFDINRCRNKGDKA